MKVIKYVKTENIQEAEASLSIFGETTYFKKQEIENIEIPIKNKK